MFIHVFDIYCSCSNMLAASLSAEARLACTHSCTLSFITCVCPASFLHYPLDSKYVPAHQQPGMCIWTCRTGQVTEDALSEGQMQKHKPGSTSAGKYVEQYRTGTKSSCTLKYQSHLGLPRAYPHYARIRCKHWVTPCLPALRPYTV